VVAGTRLDPARRAESAQQLWPPRRTASGHRNRFRTPVAATVSEVPFATARAHSSA
jgi:hypothetical protein